MPFLVSLCFFLSGASSLCFEILWTRRIELVFGASSLALSSVLASYMAGLAFGSLLAGRFSDHIRRPLLGYALCELGVAIWAFVLPLLLSVYPSIYRLLWASFHDSFLWFSLLRFVLVFLCLVVPTTLMGASLPLLTKVLALRHPEASPKVLGRAVAKLYTVNLAGALFGSLLCGFGLLPTLGMWQSTLVAASINLVLPIFLWLSTRRRVAAEGEEDLEAILAREALAQEEEISQETIAAPALRVVKIAFAISGFLAMLYQLLWTRVLAIVLGSSVYAFSLIVGCFLAGLFGGGALGTRTLKTSAKPLQSLALLHLGVAITAWGSSLFLDRLPRFFLALLPYQGEDLWQLLSINFLVIALVVLLPATVMGAIFPYSLRLLHQGSRAAATEVGDAYAINTLGSIVGSFVGGFVFLPLFGVERSLQIATISSAGLASVLLFSRVRLHVAILPIAAFVLLLLVTPRWDLARLNEGLFRPILAREVMRDEDYGGDKQLRYYEDGFGSTVVVEDFGENRLALKVNGKVDASSGGDMPTQILAGALPVLLHPEIGQKPLDAAVIGFGSGVTLGAALQFPLRSLDVIEIEANVVEAARLFSFVNHNVHEDPRLRVHIDDGRNFLQATQRTYDVIINEPSNPWIAGVANLFSREYFETIRAQLRPGGVFLQWVQLYEISPETLQLILRTFREVFPDSFVFCADFYSPDLFLVVADKKQLLDIASLSQKFMLPRVATELSAGGVTSPYALLARLVAGPEELARLAGEGPIHNDDNGILEFWAPRDLFVWRKQEHTRTNFYEHAFERWKENLALDAVVQWSGPESPLQQAKLSEQLARMGRFRAALRYADRAEGLEDGASSLQEPLGPARKGPWQGGRWFGATARARVATALLASPDAEAVEVLESLAKNPVPPRKSVQELRPPKDDIVALLHTLVGRAERKAETYSYFTQEGRLERALAWKPVLEAVAAFEEFLQEGPMLLVFRGIIDQKLGFWRDAIDEFAAALETTPRLRERMPILSYFLARAEYDGGELARAFHEMSWYLLLQESELATVLRTQLLPVPQIIP